LATSSRRTLIAIVSPNAAPIKRIVQEARESGRLIERHLRAAHPRGRDHGQRSCDPFRHSAGSTIANRLDAKAENPTIEDERSHDP
jgi:hypothetical protein